jgi:uncharacterized LabA/DUF88 family protein
MADERVMIYIDGSNLYHSLRSECGRTDLNFEELASQLVAGRALVRVYYYNAPKDQTKESDQYARQQRWFDYIRQVPYTELRLGRLVYREWPKVPPYEKGVDVRLATDMLVHGFRDNYDTAVLVSGDNDFSDALQAVKELGKHVEVALFGGAKTSQQLRAEADKVVVIDSAFLEDCWRNK